LPVFEGAAPLADVGEFRQEMEAAGFRDVEIHTLEHQAEIPSVRTFWEVQTRGSAPVVLLRETLGPADWAEHPVKLAEAGRAIREEHEAEKRERRVELAVAEGQRLAIRHASLHVRQPRLGRPAFELLDHLPREINRDHAGCLWCGHERDGPWSRSYVEHLRTRGQACEVQGVLGEAFERREHQLRVPLRDHVPGVGSGKGVGFGHGNTEYRIEQNWRAAVAGAK
jgi:hypothetical protein